MELYGRPVIVSDDMPETTIVVTSGREIIPLDVRMGDDGILIAKVREEQADPKATESAEADGQG